MKTFFFCGIGGSGMNALALFLKHKGHVVSGSDRQWDKNPDTPVFKMLQEKGILLFPQDGSGIDENVDCLVVSSAVEESVPDVAKALSLNIPVKKRAEILAESLQDSHVIAVGGTSGKTTVTGMTGHILHEAGVDPDVINGGIMLNYNHENLPGNVLFGKSPFSVIEADESDGSIALYKPAVAIVNNITLDHKPLPELRVLFADFVRKASVGAVLNADCPETAGLISLNANVLTYSLTDNDADLTAKDITPTENGVSFNLDGDIFTLNVPGRHNVSNALASIACADLLGVPRSQSKKALSFFSGIKRRLQYIGEKNGITVIDDFAHNPEKISATIETLKEKDGRLILIYQPHGFGPTKLLKNGLIHVFSKKTHGEDVIIFPEIYYAGGSAEKDISSADLVKELERAGKRVHFIADRKKIIKLVSSLAKKNDRIVVMGARDDTLTLFARDILNAL